MFSAALIFLPCVFQIVFSQCIADSAAPFSVGVVGYGTGDLGFGYSLGGSGWVGTYPRTYESMGAYGGLGTADVTVAGDLPVVGNTVVIGQVPVIGNVQFGGKIPAGGVISVTGSCNCGLNGAVIY